MHILKMGPQNGADEGHSGGFAVGAGHRTEGSLRIPVSKLQLSPDGDAGCPHGLHKGLVQRDARAHHTAVHTAQRLRRQLPLQQGNVGVRRKIPENLRLVQLCIGIKKQHLLSLFQNQLRCGNAALSGSQHQHLLLSHFSFLPSPCAQRMPAKASMHRSNVTAVNTVTIRVSDQPPSSK